MVHIGKVDVEANVIKKTFNFAWIHQFTTNNLDFLTFVSLILRLVDFLSEIFIFYQTKSKFPLLGLP
jgi:hypothetical protein